MTRIQRHLTDFRPLKTIELSPPDYRINPQLLLESCIEMEIKYCGIIPDIAQSFDPTNRTDVLRVIDRGKKDKYLPRISKVAIFYLNAYNIKLLTRDSNEDILLRLPIHQVAAVSYICDDDSHILAIKYGDYDSTKQSSRSSSSDDSTLCNMAVLYCESRKSAEQLCSLVDQCFQTVYTDATMHFFDRNLLERKRIRDATISADYSYNDKSVDSTPKNGSTGEPVTLGFLSHSSVDLGTLSSATSRSLSRTAGHNNDGELSNAANKLILDYMRELYDKLNPEELMRFASLVKAWHTELSFSDFLNGVLELYGPERQHLLVEMQPFIPAKDLSYFEHFIERVGLVNSRTTTSAAGRNFRVPVNSMPWYQHSSSLSDSVEGFDMLSDAAAANSSGSDRHGSGTKKS